MPYVMLKKSLNSSGMKLASPCHTTHVIIICLMSSEAAWFIKKFDHIKARGLYINIILLLCQSADLLVQVSAGIHFRHFTSTQYTFLAVDSTAPFSASLGGQCSSQEGRLTML